MDTNDARLRVLARRWGLVSLGALSIVATRFLLVFLDQWVSFRRVMDWRALSARMSQLKPWPWKAPLSGYYIVILSSLLAASLVTLFVLGIRDAIRAEEDEPR